MTQPTVNHLRPPGAQRLPGNSFLSWPAWLRVLAVLPAVVLLWLLVVWASAEVPL